MKIRPCHLLAKKAEARYRISFSLDGTSADHMLIIAVFIGLSEELGATDGTNYGVSGKVTDVSGKYTDVSGNVTDVIQKDNGMSERIIQALESNEYNNRKLPYIPL